MIKIFDHEGTFIREIEGDGDGPGEFRSIINVEVIDGESRCSMVRRGRW